MTPTHLMDTNAVFDRLFKDFPGALESKSLRSQRPQADLKWRRRNKGSYLASGPRGGVLSLSYNERSNKITLKRVGKIR